MLKQRVITAVVLLAAFLGTLLFAAPPIFCIFTEIVVLWGAWEWTQLMGVKKRGYRLLYVLFLCTFMQGIFFFSVPMNICEYAFYVTFFFWLLTIPLIALYPRALFWKKSMLCQAAMGMFVLIPSWFAINFIRVVNINGQYLLLYLFVLIWGADIAAYFIGKKWGRKPLAFQVSPGKTWIGVYGGILVALIITAATLYWVSVPYAMWPYTLVLTLITIVFSVVGDLFESMFKRSEGLKDSGKLLPGHGGLLDRIDSLTAAAPIFTLGAIILSRLTG
jgi:phosphatidate cytidylyltransferase